MSTLRAPATVPPVSAPAVGIAAPRRIVGGSCATVAVLCATLFLKTGCIDPAAAPPDDVVKGLSALVLDPAIDCSTLRRAFGLDYLPLADVPSDAGMEFEQHFIPTPDDNVLHVWYLPTKLDRGTVVLSIGSSSGMNCYLYVARLLVRNGWAVVMYEYQGFGLSTGRPSLNTITPDLEAVLDWSLHYLRRDSVSLLGISLGAIPSVAVAARRPEVVNALILDSPVALGEEIARFDALLGGEAAALVNRLSPELVSEERIREVTQPLLIFLHELDDLTTPQQTELLYSRAPGTKKLVRFPNLDHAEGPYYSTDVYTYNLDTFLTAVWGG